jgi:hypothetical protein
MIAFLAKEVEKHELEDNTLSELCKRGTTGKYILEIKETMLFFLYGGRKRIPSSVCSSQILL